MYWPTQSRIVRSINNFTLNKTSTGRHGIACTWSTKIQSHVSKVTQTSLNTTYSLSNSKNTMYVHKLDENGQLKPYKLAKLQLSSISP